MYELSSSVMGRISAPSKEPFHDKYLGDLMSAWQSEIMTAHKSINNMACWVFKHKYVDGLTLEQMLDKNTGAEQYIIAMDILFDKYMEMTDEDYKNDIDHVEPS